MVTIIKYFFYRIYSLGKKRGQHDPMPACFLVSMFVFVNFATILGIAALLMDSSVLEIGRGTILGITFLIVYLCYRLLIRGGKLVKVCREFDSYKKSFVKLNILLILYIVGTVVIFLNVVKATRELF